MDRGVVQVVLAAILWGTWSLHLRPTGLPGTVSGPIVMAVIGLTALPLLRGDPIARWDRATIGLLVAYAVLDALNVVTFFAAMQITTVAVAVLTHSLAPVLVALIAPRIDRVRVPGSAIAALIAVAGLALVLRPWEHVQGNVWVGAMLGGASALAYAALIFIAGALTKRIGIGRATSYHSLLAALMLAPLAISDLHRVTLVDVGHLALGAILSGTLAGWLFLGGLRRIGSARAAVLALIEPVVAVLAGWLVFHEEVGPTAIAGALLVLGAGAWVSRKPRPV